jgi:diacylglycerol O-acyltransferase
VIMEGQGLNITVQSYLDRLDFGLVACPELVPDVDDLLKAILGEIDTLAGLAAAQPPQQVRKATS